MLLFERMHALHGFENTLRDLYLERERIERLADRIVEFDLGIIENIGRRFPGRIHGFSFTDDWGTERAGFISPKAVGRVLQAALQAAVRRDARPRLARVDAFVRQGGRVHRQPDRGRRERAEPAAAARLRRSGRRLAGALPGRVCLESLCDIQHTLPFASDDAIREEARLLVEHWGTPAGGFVLSDYGDGQAIGVPIEKKQVMLDAFLAADRWSTHPDERSSPPLLATVVPSSGEGDGGEVRLRNEWQAQFMNTIFTPHAPAPGGHYSQAVVHGGIVYVAGQLPIDPSTGEQACGAIEEQTEQALRNVAAILEAAGSDLAHVLKTTVYIADISLWGRVNAVYAHIFGEHRPARSIVPTRDLHYGFLWRSR